MGEKGFMEHNGCCPSAQGCDMERAWAQPVKQTAFGQASAGIEADLPWQDMGWWRRVCCSEWWLLGLNLPKLRLGSP